MATEIYSQYGLDIDDIFWRGNGGQALGYYDPTGVDIGQRFAAGSSDFSTGLYTGGSDISRRLGGAAFGIYRCGGVPWNMRRTALGIGIDADIDYWKDYLRSWVNNGGGMLNVTGLTDDEYARPHHSSNRYSFVVYAFSPWKKASVSFNAERVQIGWSFHGSSSQNYVYGKAFEVSAYLKGWAFSTNIRAGGGTREHWKFTASQSGYGTKTYEVLIGANNDSNLPYVGTYGFSETNIYGRNWYWHQ